MKRYFEKGQLLVELVLTIGLAAIIIPALLTGLVASREGKPQQQQRLSATALMKETVSAVRSARDNDWNTFAALSTGTPYYPSIVNNRWTLSPGASTSAGFTRQVVISNVNRDTSGAIVPTGGTLDPSTKKADITISWTHPSASSLSSTIYLTRTLNLTASHSAIADFTPGTKIDVQVTGAPVTDNGSIKLANNNKAKWCSPSFSKNSNGTEITIDLPDGPPVAVVATASATSVDIPNDVFVATAPTATSSVKLAYVNVTANSTPSATLRGRFTLDASKYSNASYVPNTGTIGLDNNFITTDVKYYRSGNNTYALIGTNLPNRELIAVLVNDNNSSNDNDTTGEFQDPVNKIFKYKTFFNTRQYAADTRSTPNQDSSPYGYGASSIAVLGTKAYVASGGFLYVVDLSNIDSKTTSSGLDMQGCRIELDGFECKPGSPGTAEKYNPNQTGASWGNDTTPIHNDCSDGGNIELLATNDIYPVKVGNNTYVYVAIGGVTNPEFEIVDVTTVPSTNRSNDSSCGTIAGGDSTWSVSGSKDFNTGSGTEEASNSVFANADGSRAYISSNGGADSKQFYILNTTSKTSPSFLTGTSTPTSGFYNGASPAPVGDSELYPRRSLTVLNGLRAVLVGKDGVSNGNNAEEYQVLELDNPNESTPRYCKGLDYLDGFNDLTSVSELDSDNYVYMIANTQLNELKIIEGGPDNALFVPSGTYESSAIDVPNIAAFNRFIANIVQPAQSTIQMQVAVAPASGSSCPTSSSNYTYVGPSGDSSTYFTPSGTTISGVIPLVNYLPNYSNPNRCFRYKTILNTSNQTITPELDDIIVNYSL